MVNASLWTLPLQVWMYVLLGCTWGAVKLMPKMPPVHFVVAVRILAVLLILA